MALGNKKTISSNTKGSHGAAGHMLGSEIKGAEQGTPSMSGKDQRQKKVSETLGFTFTFYTYIHWG